MHAKTLLVAAVAAAALAVPGVASANDVVAWNKTMVDALLVSHTAPQPGTRVGAIVQTAVFDAVNGITGRYSQYRPDAIGATAPEGASVRAAAVGAAYTTLVALFPLQKSTFDAELAATLPDNNGQAVVRGFTWGQTVANAILALRSSDGFTAALPPYVVGPLPAWQPALPLFAGPVQRQFATMTPWAMSSPAQFDPGPPPSLTSLRYTQDFNEVRLLGNLANAGLYPDNRATAQFWNGTFDTVATMWNRVAESLATNSEGSLTQDARLFGLTNIAMADAVISVWNAKNTYNAWRPITAIQNAGIYDNTGTSPDPSWRPILPTPPHQEYPSGHSGVSSAATAVFTSFFGNDTTFSVSSDGIPGVPSTVRSYSSFSDAISEVALARVAAGIHFRFSCNTAAQMGKEVAGYAITTQMLPLQGDDNQK
jgi:hypothetical protein